MGNRSNASAEIEYDGALATMVGDEGAGIRTIVQMVQMTRLDCALGSAALIRQGLVRAIHHCRSRRAFGRQLIDHPLMATVLADLALEAQASMILAMRVAELVDQAQENSDIRPLARLGPAIAKYWICKRAPMVLAEAMECLGRNGYVEDSGLPRLYCEAPVNSIWEGSGNVICLDVLRTLAREPLALEAYWQEVSSGPLDDRRYCNAIDDLKSHLAVPPDQLEARARWLVERMALIW
jgi:putative acyl-CoA dehydrogenase